ncbi:MAG: ATP-binding cassette domain-containing protein [Deltaproteobacteria bacterium]|nr:ATP-binding cassette domain-containing protein [Deltaproteobacteria bacterium]
MIRLVLDQATWDSSERSVLHPVSLTFQADAPNLLMGPNGAGKTTLLRLAAGLLVPSRGRVWVEEEPFPPCPPRGGEVCLATQRPVFFSGSVARNLELPLKWREQREGKGKRKGKQNVPGRAARKQQVAEALALAGFTGREQATALSGGESQRLAMARLAALAPQAALLDEPTTALDPANRAAVTRMVLAMAQNHRTLVVAATHDPALARALGGRVWFVRQGQVSGPWPVEEFLTRPPTPQAARYLAGEVQAHLLERNEE